MFDWRVYDYCWRAYQREAPTLVVQRRVNLCFSAIVHAGLVCA